MRKIYKLIVIATITIIGTLVSCHENIIDERLNNGSSEDTEFKDIRITNQINIQDLPEGVNLNNLKILTLNGKVDVDANGVSNIETYEGYLPQILMLVNQNDELLLMSRGDFHEGEKNEMSIRSTAVALVTMHPALSGVKSHVYNKLEQLVIESPSFDELEEAIANAVHNGNSFADPDNTLLTTALNKVFEQVVAATEEETSDGELPNLTSNTYARAPELKGVTTIAGINVGPFHVTTSGSSVVVENYSLTPFYSGWVTHHGQQDEFNIPSGNDRGITFFLDNSWGSQKVSYSFVQEGEYQFFFDKTTAESYLDQSRHTICNVLEVLGLPLSKGWMLETANDMQKFMIERGIDIIGLITNPNTDAWDITQTVCGGIIDYIKDGRLETMLLKIGTKKASSQIAQALLKKTVAVYTVYQTCRGTINAVMRITMRLESPDNVAFGLYYYQGEITTATKAALEKYSGDNQNGLIGHRLNEPVRVKVTTIGSDGSQVAASNFHRVKFETEANNGTVLNEIVATSPDGYAQTFWTLEPNNTEMQYLKATVIDIVTGEKISETVTFCAQPTQAANITFTLDWSPTDSNCDIDLHIYDPDGHHIYYSDMSCSCGGYLDRDDRHGPGPEHIYYTQAKPGKYHVYVHHYYSDVKGTVGFTVTTEYDERRFVNRSSVSYDEYVYIGTLDVGGNSAISKKRSASEIPEVRFYYDKNAPAFSKEKFPKK